MPMQECGPLQTWACERTALVELCQRDFKDLTLIGMWPSVDNLFRAQQYQMVDG